MADTQTLLILLRIRYESTVDEVIDRLEFVEGLDKMGLGFGKDSLNLLDDQKVCVCAYVCACVFVCSLHCSSNLPNASFLLVLTECMQNNARLLASIDSKRQASSSNLEASTYFIYAARSWASDIPGETERLLVCCCQCEVCARCVHLQAFLINHIFSERDTSSSVRELSGQEFVRRMRAMLPVMLTM
eukprot:1149509-Pelagomonas_calceolata.AAC.5